MPKERTPESGVPFGTKVKRMMPGALGGRKGDRRLPMPTEGQRDPKLPPPSQLEQIREGLDRVRSLGKQSSRSGGRSKRATARRA